MTYRSTYKESLGDYIQKYLDQYEIDIFYMLFNGFGCKQKLQSAFFELFRVGDGKYTLTVQKYVNGTWSVKFKHNENFSNKAERFTK